MTAIGVMGLLATKNSNYASWFVTGLYIYGVFISGLYAFCLFGVMILAINFPTCDKHSSGSCSSSQGYAIGFMVIFMVVDVILFGMVTLVTYAIRDGKRLLS